jgi:hypothetical protein
MYGSDLTRNTQTFFASQMTSLPGFYTLGRHGVQFHPDFDPYMLKITKKSPKIKFSPQDAARYNTMPKNFSLIHHFLFISIILKLFIILRPTVGVFDDLSNSVTQSAKEGSRMK